jgi:hypothetical protein
MHNEIGVNNCFELSFGRLPVHRIAYKATTHLTLRPDSGPLRTFTAGYRLDEPPYCDGLRSRPSC